MRAMTITALAALALGNGTSASAQVERIWLTHRTHDPSKVVATGPP